MYSIFVRLTFAQSTFEVQNVPIGHLCKSSETTMSYGTERARKQIDIDPTTETRVLRFVSSRRLQSFLWIFHNRAKSPVPYLRIRRLQANPNRDPSFWTKSRNAAFLSQSFEEKSVVFGCQFRNVGYGNSPPKAIAYISSMVNTALQTSLP